VGETRRRAEPATIGPARVSVPPYRKANSRTSSVAEQGVDLIDPVVACRMSSCRLAVQAAGQVVRSFDGRLLSAASIPAGR